MKSISHKVRVSLGERSYDIRIGTCMALAEPVGKGAGRRALIVTDANVNKRYGASAQAAVSRAGWQVSRAVVPAGEATKCLRWAGRLYEAAISAGLDRSSVIIALGGGMVGDLAGFVAATYMRGIGFVQVPTTLLAMVDSSVGGKTGINLPRAKNMVGAFYQPSAVVVDVETLSTLPKREYVSGLAEVVKYGVISDAALFARIERNADALLARKTEVVADIVACCCRIKARVVSSDERESGLRAILNFGHTLGHAVESVGGYGRLLHGEAVAIGMVFAAQVSRRAVGLAQADADRIVALLARLGLPTGYGRRKPRWSDMVAAMASDKKSVGGIPRFVLADRIGHATPGHGVGRALLRRTYEEL